VTDPEVAGTIDLYAALIGLRRAHEVLSTGGLRWLHVGDDALVYVRESAGETVLLLATRAAADVSLPAWTVPVDVVVGTLPAELGPAVFSAGPEGLRLAATGASFTAWVLPGVTIAADAHPVSQRGLAR